MSHQSLGGVPSTIEDPRHKSFLQGLKENDVDKETRVAALEEDTDIEDWRNVGGVDQPAFENSWVSVSGEAVAAFYKDPYKRVHIKGAVDTGTNGTTIFTLPEGYRPLEKLRLITTKLTTVIGLVTIDTDGTVDSSVGNTNGVSINFSFKAA